jgi:hypothetical protein
MSAPAVATASSSRARPQARKKANDDASYFGPSTSTSGVSGTKRQAADKLEGEPRVKRKRVDAVSATVQAAAKKDTAESELRLSLVRLCTCVALRDEDSPWKQVEFNKMSIDELHRYVAQFDIVPAVHPSPLLPDDPPVPMYLGTVTRHASRAPSPPSQTPANRPRRESREAQRRSSRLLEDDLPPYRTPALADIAELQGDC